MHFNIVRQLIPSAFHPRWNTKIQFDATTDVPGLNENCICLCALVVLWLVLCGLWKGEKWWEPGKCFLNTRVAEYVWGDVVSVAVLFRATGLAVATQRGQYMEVFGKTIPCEPRRKTSRVNGLLWRVQSWTWSECSVFIHRQMYSRIIHKCCAIR